MKKSILRFGALALMSWMSIGAFAQSEGTYIYLTNGTDNGSQAKGTYYVTKAATENEHGQVKLVTAEGSEGIYSFPNGYTPEGEVQLPVLGTIVSEQHNVFDVVEIGANAFGTQPDPSTVQTVAPVAPIKNTTLAIPATVKKIGAKAFSWLDGNGCMITFEGGSQLVEIGADAFNADESYTTAQPVTVPAGAAITITNATLDLTLLDENNLGGGAFEDVQFAENATVKFGNITKIPAYLFKGAKNIVTVEFANSGNDGTSGLNEIGSNAFSTSTQTIAYFGYKDTSSGTPRYILPRQLNTIGNGAFQNALAPNAEFLFSDVNKGVIKNVGSYAFDGCKVIDNTHFANLFEVLTLDYAAGSFKNCSLTGLLDLTDSPVSTSIPAYAFADNYAAGTSPAASTGLTKVILPSTIKEIGDGAFSGCQMLGECALHEGLTTIGASAFEDALNYLTIDIPHTVTFVGENAFEVSSGKYLTGNRKISIQSKEAVATNAQSSVIKTTVSNPNYYTYTAHSPFGTNGGTSTTLVVPMSVLKDYAFAKNEAEGYNWTAASGLTLNTYGTAYTNVATTPVYFYNGAFKYQVAADWSPEYSQNWTVPQVKLVNVCTWNQNKKGGDTKSRTNFNENNVDGSAYTKVFSGDVLNLPQTVVKAGENTDVKKYSFVYYELVDQPSVADNNEGLTSNDYAPVNPVNLKTTVKTVNIQANDLDLTGVFKDFTALGAVNFQAIATDNTTGWWGAKEKTPLTVKIGASAFEGCTSLTSFTPSVTYREEYNQTLVRDERRVGASAFAGCTSLANVTIPAGVTDIDASAYSNTIISSVELPSTLKTIGASAFANTGLTAINIPESVEEIGVYAFDGKSVQTENGYEFQGVLDVTVNWTNSIPEDVNVLAFGDPVGFQLGNTITYIKRHLYIPAGSTTLYQATATPTTPFKDATKFQLAEAITVKKKSTDNGRLDIKFENGVKTLTIDDTQGLFELNIPTVATDVKVTYMRSTPYAAIPYPLFVPFSVEGATDEYQIYKVFDTKVYEDGSEGIEYVKETGKTLPNKPYIFIPKAGVESIDFVADGYEATTEGGLIMAYNDAKSIYSFYGTYTQKRGDYTESGKSIYVLTSENTFRKPVWIDNNPNQQEYLGALRFYMTKVDNPNNPYATQAPNVKIILLDDEDVTAIANLKANSLNAPMFDLQGRQITAPAKGQVYIQDGVKKLAR